MARTRGRCWAHVITTGVAVCMIALGAGSCKTTKPKDLRTKDPAPKTDTKGRPKKTVGDTAPSSLKIDSIVLSSVIIGGNTVFQAEVNTSDTYDYIKYSVNGLADKIASTNVFTLPDAPEGEDTLVAQLCLRASDTCGDAVTQGFTQPVVVNKEVQAQMIAGDAAGQQIVQASDDLAKAATEYTKENPDDTTPVGTAIANIGAIGADGITNAVNSGVLEVIDSAPLPPALAGDTAGTGEGTPATGGTAEEGASVTSDTGGAKTADSAGTTTGTAATGGGSNSSSTALLALGVPSIVFGASAALTAGAYSARLTRKIDALKNELKKYKEEYRDENDRIKIENEIAYLEKQNTGMTTTSADIGREIGKSSDDINEMINKNKELKKYAAAVEHINKDIFSYNDELKIMYEKTGVKKINRLCEEYKLKTAEALTAEIAFNSDFTNSSKSSVYLAAEAEKSSIEGEIKTEAKKYKSLQGIADVSEIVDKFNKKINEINTEVINRVNKLTAAKADITKMENEINMAKNEKTKKSENKAKIDDKIAKTTEELNIKKGDLKKIESEIKASLETWVQNKKSNLDIELQKHQNFDLRKKQSKIAGGAGLGVMVGGILATTFSQTLSLTGVKSHAKSRKEFFKKLPALNSRFHQARYGQLLANYNTRKAIK